MSVPQLKYYPEIDGVRGVMAVCVVLAHLIRTVNWPTAYSQDQLPLFWVSGCMDIFFCISAFCITRNLTHMIQSRPDWITYYLKKRALRIWPAYYPALFVCAAVSLWVPLIGAAPDMVWNGDPAYLARTMLFLQNTEMWFGGSSTGAIPTFGHSWSVAIEEQFYLLIVLLLFIRHRFHIFSGYSLIIPALLLLPLGQLARHVGMSNWTLPGRFDPFLFGIALAIACPMLEELAERLRALTALLRGTISAALLTAAIPFLLPFLLTHGDIAQLPRIVWAGPFDPIFASGLFGAGLLLSIVLLPVTPLHRALRTPIARYLGDISYSVYLFHIPAMYVTRTILLKAGMESRWAIGAICFLVIFAVATQTYRFIERPFLRRKEALALIDGARA